MAEADVDVLAAQPKAAASIPYNGHVEAVLTQAFLRPIAEATDGANYGGARTPNFGG